MEGNRNLGFRQRSNNSDHARKYPPRDNHIERIHSSPPRELKKGPQQNRYQQEPDKRRKIGSYDNNREESVRDQRIPNQNGASSYFNSKPKPYNGFARKSEPRDFKAGANSFRNQGRYDKNSEENSRTPYNHRINERSISIAPDRGRSQSVQRELRNDNRQGRVNFNRMESNSNAPNMSNQNTWQPHKNGNYIQNNSFNGRENNRNFNGRSGYRNSNYNHQNGRSSNEEYNSESTNFEESKNNKQNGSRAVNNQNKGSTYQRDSKNSSFNGKGNQHPGKMLRCDFPQILIENYPFLDSPEREEKHDPNSMQDQIIQDVSLPFDIDHIE